VCLDKAGNPENFRTPSPFTVSSIRRVHHSVIQPVDQFSPYVSQSIPQSTWPVYQSRSVVPSSQRPSVQTTTHNDCQTKCIPTLKSHESLLQCNSGNHVNGGQSEKRGPGSQAVNRDSVNDFIQSSDVAVKKRIMNEVH
jgi:hypothetical protein